TDIQANGTRIDRIYYPPNGGEDSTTVDCPPDPHGFQRYLKAVIVTPSKSAYQTPSRSWSYTYRRLPTANGARTDYFVACGKRLTLEENQCITSTEYTYI